MALGLRDRFFDYCDPAKREESAGLLQRQAVVIKSSVRSLLRGVPSEFRLEAYRELHAISDTPRLDALCELHDLWDITANEASAPALEYWLMRVRWNNYPEHLLSATGINAYERWLRQTVRPTMGELRFALYAQEHARREFTKHERAGRHEEQENATARIPT